MQLSRLFGLILLSFVLILPIKVSLANEENFELGEVTKEGDSLEGIESRDVSNDFWNLEEGEYHDKPSNPHLSPNTNVQIERNDANQQGENPLNQTPSDDKTDKLNSNYGDVKPTGGKIPLVDF